MEGPKPIRAQEEEFRLAERSLTQVEEEHALLNAKRVLKMKLDQYRGQKGPPVKKIKTATSVLPGYQLPPTWDDPIVTSPMDRPSSKGDIRTFLRPLRRCPRPQAAGPQPPPEAPEHQVHRQGTAAVLHEVQPGAAAEPPPEAPKHQVHHQGTAAVLHEVQPGAAAEPPPEAPEHQVHRQGTAAVLHEVQTGAAAERHEVQEPAATLHQVRQGTAAELQEVRPGAAVLHQVHPEAPELQEVRPGAAVLQQVHPEAPEPLHQAHQGTAAELLEVQGAADLHHTQQGEAAGPHEIDEPAGLHQAHQVGDQVRGTQEAALPMVEADRVLHQGPDQVVQGGQGVPRQVEGGGGHLEPSHKRKRGRTYKLSSFNGRTRDREALSTTLSAMRRRISPSWTVHLLHRAAEQVPLL